jgi:multiple sugar transport system permease protein
LASVTRQKKVHTGLWSNNWVPLLMLTPAMLFVLGILGYAVVNGFIMSLYKVEVWTVGQPFVGLENYIKLFEDPKFINSLTRSLIFVAGTIIFGMGLALSFALVLNQVRQGRGFFRGIALVPYLVSGVATAVMWRFMFVGETALINQLMDLLGMAEMTWLGDPNRALLVVTMANIWFISPFATLILLAGLQTIDSTLYEAASIDGASPLQKFVHITIPGLAPMLALSLMWLSFASFNMFDIILPLTGGGPGRATEVLAVYMYQLAFRDLSYSSASAVMMVLLVINLSFSILYLWLFRERR